MSQGSKPTSNRPSVSKMSSKLSNANARNSAGKMTSKTDTLSLMSSQIEAELAQIMEQLEKMQATTCQKKDVTITHLKEKQQELEKIYKKEKTSLTDVISVMETVDPNSIDLESKVVENLKKRKVSIRKLQEILEIIQGEIGTLQEQYNVAIKELEAEQKIVQTTLREHFLNISGPLPPEKLISSITPTESVHETEEQEIKERSAQKIEETEAEAEPEVEPHVEEDSEVKKTTSAQEETVEELIYEKLQSAEILHEEIVQKESSIKEVEEKLAEEVRERIGSIQGNVKKFYETNVKSSLDNKGYKIDKHGNVVTPNGLSIPIAKAISKGLLPGIEVETAEYAFIDFLSNKGLHITSSCNLMTRSGEIITMEQARMMGLLDGMDEEVENLIFPNMLSLKNIKMKMVHKDGRGGVKVVMGGKEMTLQEANEAKVFDDMMYDTAHYILSIFLAHKGLTLSSPSHVINLRNEEGRGYSLEEAKEAGLLEDISPEIFQMIFNVLINQRELKILPDGNLETNSGQIFTLQEAKMLGLLDGIVLPEEEQQRLICLAEQYGLKINDRGLIETLGGTVTLKEARLVGILTNINHSIIQKYVEATSSTTSSSQQHSITSGLSEPSLEETENAIYLKKTLGGPLAKCLAEVTAKKPNDPVHYVAHWLYNYRIQEEKDVARKAELTELLEERKRLQHNDTMEEARKMVLKMIYRAEVDAELLRIARLQAEAEAEEGDANMLDYQGQFFGLV